MNVPTGSTNEPTRPGPERGYSLAGRVCLVTGGSRGIGRAIAKALLGEGAAVTICGRRQETVDATVAELAAEHAGKVEGRVADVKNHEEVGALFQFVDTRFGGVDVLVNNAGVGVFRPVSEITLEEWRAVLDTNLSGAFYCSREALFRFVTRGGGHIVNIVSLAGAHAFAGGSAYNASKFGLTGFSEAVMQDVRSENVRVSYVMPGSVATEFGHPASAGSQGQGPAEGSDWKIWPEDVAEVVRMLLLMPARTLISRVEIRPTKAKIGSKR